MSWLRPLAIITAPVLALAGVMSFKFARIRYWFNLGVYLSALGFCSLLGVFYGVFGSLVGQVRYRAVLYGNGRG